MHRSHLKWLAQPELPRSAAEHLDGDKMIPIGAE